MATCTDKDVARSLALNYGIYTSIVPVVHDTDEMIKLAKERTQEFFKLGNENKIIITGGLPITGKSRLTNFIKIEEIN